jgi:hypothetical protein
VLISAILLSEIPKKCFIEGLFRESLRSYPIKLENVCVNNRKNLLLITGIIKPKIPGL